jgi:integrase
MEIPSFFVPWKGWSHSLQLLLIFLAIFLKYNPWLNKGIVVCCLKIICFFTAHEHCHTGCSRLGENNVNPKVMRYIMDHSDTQVTMNVYNHIAEKSHVENEMSKMNLQETVPAVV